MTETETDKNNIGRLGYVLGGASFIPLLGLPLGLIAIIWGVTKWKQKGWHLIALGLGGIIFTASLCSCVGYAYSSLFYKGFVERGGVYDDLRTQLAKSLSENLNFG